MSNYKAKRKRNLKVSIATALLFGSLFGMGYHGRVQEWWLFAAYSIVFIISSFYIGYTEAVRKQEANDLLEEVNGRIHTLEKRLYGTPEHVLCQSTYSQVPCYAPMKKAKVEPLSHKEETFQIPEGASIRCGDEDYVLSGGNMTVQEIADEANAQNGGWSFKAEDGNLACIPPGPRHDSLKIVITGKDSRHE